MADAFEHHPTEKLPDESASDAASFAANIPIEPDPTASRPKEPASAAPQSIPPPGSPFAPSPRPPPPPVEEVEAVRITRAETRGPAIEVPGVRHVAEAPPAQPSAPPGTAPFGAAVPSSPLPADETIPPPPQTPPTPPPTPPPAATPTAPVPQRFWIALCHLAYLIPGYVPGLALTLLIWAWRRKRDPLLDDQGREALNFQLTYAALSLILTVTCLLCVLVPVVWIVGAVLCVVAGVSGADGQRYRYPWIVRLIT